MQSSGKSSSVKVAVGWSDCRPCAIASTSCGLKNAKFDQASDITDPARRDQTLFVACQCASASCGFEIAGSMISPCFPVLAAISMT